MLRIGALLAIALSATPAAAVTISDYFVSPPGSLPFGIAPGPDGNVWFTAPAAASIFRVTPAGLVTQYVIPHGPNPGPGPMQIVAGPDGGMWFTEGHTAAWGGNKIGRIDPATGMITEFPLPTPEAGPFGIALGSDGALWFAEAAVHQIGRITTAGSISEFPIAAQPNAMVAGPDGALWFTYLSGGGVGRFTTSGAVSYFPLPWQIANGIAVGPDSRLWFISYAAASGGPGMVRMDLDGSYVVFPLLPGSNPFGGLATGADGNLWFANGNARIGRMTVDGLQTDFRLATASNTYFVCAGPDGNVWFTEGDYVGKAVLASAGYYTVAPCRVIDTRNASGPNGAPSLTAGSTRTFTIAGHCGVPSRGTVALAVNLTVVNETGPGNLRLFPAGSAAPLSSSINFTAGVARANNAILAEDLDGRVSVFADMPGGGVTDFVLDVVGYFE